MLAAIASVQRHLAGSSLQQFITDEKTVHAVAYATSIIGEASTQLPPEVCARYPEIPWSDMRRMRNFLIHRYGRLDPVILWETAVNDLPPLTQQLRDMLEQEQ